MRALHTQLSPRQLHALDREAPERLRMPSGRLARLVYARDKPPSLAARIQDLFGLETTPRVAGGRVRIGGEVWTALPYMDGQVFEPGTRVQIAEIKGATALVLE